jgi:DNA-3-methyladenine glycosylase
MAISGSSDGPLNPIGETFFHRDPVSCARDLIGCHFEWDGCGGRIVETEAYAADEDPACHTFFRPSARSFVAEYPAGTAYVYLNYGVHWLFNLLIKGSGGAGFVLIRALEPTRGLAAMRRRRRKTRLEELCSGPGKLTQALGIGEAAHGTSLFSKNSRRICRAASAEVVADSRIGISRGKELPWRFTERASRFLSKNPQITPGNRTF